MKSKIFAACLALALPAAAIELSLEENKAERGNIGYIDMQRLFRTFPDTLRARENFEELIRQAEEQLNLRKAEILRLRGELAELRIEREFLAKTPIEIPQAAKPAPPPAPASKKGPKGSAAAGASSVKETRDRENAEVARLLEEAKKNPVPAPAAAPAPAPAPAAAPAAPTLPPPPGPDAPVSAPAVPADGAGRRGGEPETDLTRPSIASLPGFAGGPAAQPAVPETPTPVAPPPPQPTGPTEDELRAALEQSRQAAEAKKREPLVINIPGVSTAPIVVQPPEAPASPIEAALEPAPTASTTSVAAAPTAAAAEPALNPALVELDARIAVKTKELAAKELEYKTEQASSEKNLLELEGRKTEILLGKIHRAVQDIARKEGVSVVVDKSSILYGHDAVDLTEKVMKHLRGS